MNKYLISLAVLAFCTCYVSSQNPPTLWTKEEYPDPQKPDRKNWCQMGQNPTYVCNPNADLGITPGQATALNGKIISIMNRTACPCNRDICNNRVVKNLSPGFRVAIALMKGMQRSQASDSQTSEAKLKDAEMFSNYLRQKYRYGMCDELILILYSNDDKVMYLTTGKAVGPKITTNDLELIALRARSKINRGQLYSGLMGVLDDIFQALTVKDPKDFKESMYDIGSEHLHDGVVAGYRSSGTGSVTASLILVTLASIIKIIY